MSDENLTKRAFVFRTDSLKKLKLMAVEEETTQRALINQFLEDGLRNWEKSKGQTTLDD